MGQSWKAGRLALFLFVRYVFVQPQTRLLAFVESYLLFRQRFHYVIWSHLLLQLRALITAKARRVPAHSDKPFAIVGTDRAGDAWEVSA